MGWVEIQSFVIGKIGQAKLLVCYDERNDNIVNAVHILGIENPKDVYSLLSSDESTDLDEMIRIHEWNRRTENVFQVL